MIARWLFFFAAALSAQTVYLRNGGPDTRKEITGVTAGTPCTITVPSHGYANDTLIGLFAVSGLSGPDGTTPLSAIGASIFKVKNTATNTFTLGDKITGADAACTGTWRASSGFVGVVQATTLPDFPRGYLDGPSGTITSSLAGKAIAGQLPFDALKNVAEVAKTYTISHLMVREGFWPGILALAWRATGTPAYLTTYKQYINNVEQMATVTQFWCDYFDDNCGRSYGSATDYVSFFAAEWAYAFAAGADQLTSGERQAFADKLLNGWNGESCNNTRVLQSGTVAVTSGSAVVTGSGTSFSSNFSPGQLIYITTVPGSAGVQKTILTVDSNTQVTLTTTMTVTGSGFHVWRDDNWTTGSCGMLWMAAHHGFGSPPSSTTKTSNLLAAITSTSATTMRIARSRDIPHFPVYVKLDSEWVRIDSINSYATDTVNITRAMFDTTAATHSSLTLSRKWMDVPMFSRTSTTGNITPYYNGQNVMFDDSTSNHAWTKAYGVLSAGMATCGIDARGCAALEAAWNWLYDFHYWLLARHWNGTSWGSSTYGWNRWNDWLTKTAVLAKTNFSPPIDMGADPWLRDTIGKYHIYASYPNDAGRGAHWGDSSSTTLDTYMLRNEAKAFLQASYLHPGNTLIPYMWYLIDQLQGHWSTGQVGDSTNSQTTAVAFLYAPATLPESNLNGLDKWIFLEKGGSTISSFPNLGHHWASSRTAWNTGATLAITYAYCMPQDHDGSYPYPGHYQIFKYGQQLVGDRSSTIVFAPSSSMGQQQNSVGVGTSALSRTVQSEASPGGFHGQYVWFDKKKGTSDYTYIRTNQMGAFPSSSGLTKMYREQIHLTSTDPDYLIIYDQSVTSSAAPRTDRIQYPVNTNTGSASNTFTDLGSGAYSYVRGAGCSNAACGDNTAAAKVMTKIMLPLFPSVTLTQDVSSNQVLIDGGAVTTGAFLYIHRISGNTSDTMPSTGFIQTLSASHYGLQIGDSTRERLLLLLKDGDSPVTSLTYTPGSFSGTGEHVITGLQPSSYTVTLAGNAVSGSPFMVGEDGTVRFLAASGAISIAQGEAIPDLSIGTAILPGATVGTAYSVTLSGIGGVPSYTWDVVAGSLPDGLTLSSSGTISGTPTVAGVSAITVRVRDTQPVATTKELQLTVEAAAIPATTLSGSIQ